LRKVSAGEVFYCPTRFSCLSSGAQSFVKALLTFDPKLRLSATEALQHPWIQGLTESDMDLDPELTKHLCNTEQVKPFRKICLSMAAWQLSSSETEDLRRQFHVMDVSNTGALSFNTFKQVAGDDESVDIESVFASVDLGNDGEIGFNSFVVAAMEQRPQKEKLRHLFNRLDADKDGIITAKDLTTVLGPTFEGFSMRQLIREVECGGRGITWEAFSSYLMSDKVCEESEQNICFLQQKVNKVRSLLTGSATAGAAEIASNGLSKFRWLPCIPV